MKKSVCILFFIFSTAVCSENDWQMVLSQNAPPSKYGWEVVRDRDLKPPAVSQTFLLILTNGNPMRNSFRLVNPGQPIRKLAQEIKEQSAWQRYLARDRRKKWMRSLLSYSASVAKIMPVIAAGIIDNQTR